MRLLRWAVDLLLAGLIVVVLTGAGYVAGRHVARIDALQAEATPPIVRIGPRAVAARLYPRRPAPRRRAARSIRAAGSVRSVRSVRSGMERP